MTLPRSTSIILAVDWFFVYAGVNKNAKPVVWRLAAWALDSKGKVLGLISAFDHKQGKDSPPASLIAIAPAPDAYYYLSQLNGQNRKG